MKVPVSSVLIVGSKNVGSLESSYARALDSLGCKVSFWDPMAALYRVARGGRLGRIFSTFVHVEAWERKANLELLRMADETKPDLILVIATSGTRAGTLAQIKVRLPDCLLYCIYPDSPHNLDNTRMFSLPFFDRVTTSSPAWVSAFQKLGALHVHYLPFAADPSLHKPVSAAHSANPEFAHDVGFIGTWRPEREAFLEQLADLDLCVWGSSYWKSRTRRDSPLRARWGGRSITGQEFARVCAENRIMLNIMDAATWPGPNMRAFEQPACGAFSLTTRSPALLEIFKEGETVECFESVEEARAKINYYLSHEEELQRLAKAAYQLVTLKGHTYADRARQLLRWVEEDRLAH